MTHRKQSVARLIGHVAGWGMLALLLIPAIVAFWMSFTPASFLTFPTREWSWKWYRLFGTSPQWTAGLKNSLFVGLTTAAVSVIVGTGLAMLLTRHQFPGRRLTARLALWPLFVPGVVLGLAELHAAKLYGLWGTPFSLVAADSLLGVPIVFLLVRVALEAIDPDLVWAARGLGAGPWGAFRHVILPLVAPVMALGGLLAFIISFQELIMAIFLCTPEAQTLPKVIWPNLRYALTPVVAAASGVSLLATLALIVGIWGASQFAAARIRFSSKIEVGRVTLIGSDNGRHDGG